MTILIQGFEPNETIDTILGTPNDTIVAGSSQIVGAKDTSIISNVVHTDLTDNHGTDVGETQSAAIWNQALYWLAGGTGQFSGIDINANQFQPKNRAAVLASAPPEPIFDLSQYTQVAALNVVITPPSGARLTIGTPVSIQGISSTKMLTELLLYQGASDPTDGMFYYATQAPFSVFFTPARLGMTEFVVFALFSDNTFAEVPISYVFASSGSPVGLTLMAPITALPVGLSTTVHATALEPNGNLDVTSAANYEARSGGDVTPPVRPSGNTIWTRKKDEQEQAHGGGDHHRAEAGGGRAQD